MIDDGISRLPRVSKVVGGTGMLCARDLVAFANQHAPEDQYHALVDEAKADPEFCKRRDAAKVAYRGEHVAKAVKRGIPREKAEKAYDESIAAGSATIGERTWLPLTDEHVLYTPGGDAFTVADIKKDPLKYHDTECADPIEGLDYQSKNCAIIYTNRRADRDLFPRPRRRLCLCRAVRRRAVGRAVCAHHRRADFRERHVAGILGGRHRAGVRGAARSMRCATRRSGASGIYGTDSVGPRTVSARSSTWRGRSAARSRGHEGRRKKRRSPATRPRWACWGWPWTTSARRRWRSNGTPTSGSLHARRHGRSENRQDPAGVA